MNRCAGPRLGVALLAASLVLSASLHAFAPGAAQAATVLALSLEEMTRKADVIAVVLPAERQPRREQTGSLIVTDVTLEVDTALKGVKAGERIVATILGGRLDGIALQVPGEANFALGELALVFLARTRDGSELRVLGMSQGVLPIFERGQAVMVGPGGKSAGLVQPGSDGLLHDAPAALLEPQPLSDILARVRAQLEPAQRPLKSAR